MPPEAIETKPEEGLKPLEIKPTERIPRPKGYTDWYKSKHNSLVKINTIPTGTRILIADWVRDNFHIDGVYHDMKMVADKLGLKNHSVMAEYIMEVVNNMSILSDKDPSAMANILFNKAFEGFMIDKMRVDKMLKTVETSINKSLKAKRGRLDTFAVKGYSDLMSLSIQINKELVGMVKTLSSNKTMVLVDNSTKIENQQINNVENKNYVSPLQALQMLNDHEKGSEGSEGN